SLPSAGVAKTILRPSGNQFSWVLIDAEHGLINDTHYYELINAVASEGTSPIVRVPWGEEWMIKRALDAGAHGVVTPMCHSEEDAKKIVKYSKYPPVGTRGYGPMFASHSISGVVGAQYDDNADKSLSVIVQIESRPGVENVEKIAGVDGIDVLFIGPFDLAKQMGVQRGGEEHEAAIQRTLKAAHDAGKKAAIFCTSGQDADNRRQQGFDMISVITDIAVLAEGMIDQLNVAKGKSQEEKKPREGY
ncbi:2,4-dihydroxyhept-2-ene-1,7-dioic acid aldolase, partial [Lophiotrema nucula]